MSKRLGSPRQGWGCGDGHVRALPLPALPNKHFTAAASTSNSLGAGKHLAARPKCARPPHGLTAGSLPLKFYVQNWFPASSPWKAKRFISKQHNREAVLFFSKKHLCCTEMFAKQRFVSNPAHGRANTKSEGSRSAALQLIVWRNRCPQPNHKQVFI